MKKYVIIKCETKYFASSYDDIKEDKYLYEIGFKDGNPYPYKYWTSNLDRAIHFYDKEVPRSICQLLGVNTPFPLKIQEVEI